MMDAISLAAGALAAFAITSGFALLAIQRARNAITAGTQSQTAFLKAQRDQAEIRCRNLESALDKEREKLSGAVEKRIMAEAALQQERQAAAEKFQILEETRARLLDSFKVLSSEALQLNNEQFLKLARETFSRLKEGAQGDLEKRQQAIDGLVKPIREKLEAFDAKVNDLENSRKEAYGELKNQVRSLVESQNLLSRQTQTLSSALRASSSASGQWGEVQLRRIVELAGMVRHCDFDEQVRFDAAHGLQRPDMVIRLPGGKNIVIDAKAPVSAYLEAIEEKHDEERRERLMADYVANVRKAIVGLSSKEYFKCVDSPEFVVLFLPGESFFSAALERDPRLIEDSFGHRVILATPTTLLGLLKAVAYGWRQETLAENARDISEIGRQLFDRLGTLARNFGAVGKSLKTTVDNYNKTLGTFEASVLVSARKLKDKNVVADDRAIEKPAPCETHVRVLARPEFLETKDPGQPDAAP